MAYYCKFCGDSADSIRDLTTGYNSNCPNSPTGIHQPFEGTNRVDGYVCKFCGDCASSIKDLTTGYNSNCPNSPTGNHQPFEGR